MNKTFDRYAAVVFLAIAAFFMIASRQISNTTYGSSVGPAVFPFGIGLLLAIASLRLMYETFRYPQTDKNSGKLDYKRFVVMFTAAVLYCFFLEDVGYTVTTFLFLLIGFQTMQRGKIWLSLLLSAAFAIGVFYLFDQVLNVTLPSSERWLGIW